MTNLYAILGNNWEVQDAGLSPSEQLLSAMDKHGLHPQSIHIDGEIHRFGEGSTGWYIAFPDEVPSGKYGDWKKGVEHGWRASIGRSYTAIEEMLMIQRATEAKAARDAARTLKAEVAAESCKSILEKSSLATTHPYLTRKNIKPHGAFVNAQNQLMLPICNQRGEIVSIQYISESGEKRFYTGAKIAGCFWFIGSDPSHIYIAEGFATAASIHEATGKMVLIAYSASNIPATAQAARERYGSMHPITVIVDNDEHSVGQKFADIAAENYSCALIKPPFGDANDYAQTNNLKNLLEPQPEQENWLVTASEMCTDFKPVRWLIKNWIPESSLCMVYGPSGAGKTFCVLDMCLTIASNREEWFGNKVKTGTVVYLAGEGHAGLRSRVAAWAQVHKPTHMDMFLSKDGCDLNTSLGLQKVTNAITQNNITPKLIVVDTLHRFLLGDENSAQDTKTLLDACSALIRHYECSVMLVHHVGVSETAQLRPRGSSAWWGALDSSICLVPAKDEEPLKVLQLKSKDGRNSEPLSAGLDHIDIHGWFDEDGDQVDSAVFVAKFASNKSAKKSSEIFTLSWEFSGKEMVDGAPYISRSAFQNYLEKEHNVKPKQAYFRVMELVKELALVPKSNGWVNEKPS